MNELPHRQPVLEPFGKDDVLHNLRSETMAGTAPESGQTKLGIHIHLRLFQQTLSRVVKLADERKVQLRLPFLNECQFHRTEVVSSREQREWTPNEKVVMILPKPKREFSLNQSVVL